MAQKRPGWRKRGSISLARAAFKHSSDIAVSISGLCTLQRNSPVPSADSPDLQEGRPPPEPSCQDALRHVKHLTASVYLLPLNAIHEGGPGPFALIVLALCQSPDCSTGKTMISLKLRHETQTQSSFCLNLLEQKYNRGPPALHAGQKHGGRQRHDPAGVLAVHLCFHSRTEEGFRLGQGMLRSST